MGRGVGKESAGRPDSIATGCRAAAGDAATGTLAKPKYSASFSALSRPKNPLITLGGVGSIDPSLCGRPVMAWRIQNSINSGQNGLYTIELLL